MTRTKKTALLLLAALVAVALAGAIGLPLLVDADQFRPRLEKAAREKLGREVILGPMGLRVFPLPSVTVASLRVAGADPSDPPMAETGRIRVEARFLPLLAKRLEVRGLTVEDPVVRLARDRKGTWDALALLSKGSGGDGGAVKIDTIRVRRGRVLVSDASIARGKVVEVELTDIDARISGLSGGGDRDVDVEASIPSAGGGRISFDGSIGSGRSFSGRATTSNLDLGALSPYIASLGPVAGIAGIVTSDVHVERSGAETEARGTASVKGFLAGRATKGAAPVDFDADFDVEVAGSDVTITKLDLTTGGTRLRASGSAKTSQGSQVIELKLADGDLAPADLARAAGAAGFAVPSDVQGMGPMRVGGTVRLTRSPRGDEKVLDRIELDGITLAGARLTIHRDAAGSLVLPGAPKAQGKDRARAPALRIDGRNLSVKDVDVTFVDASLGKEPVTTKLENVELAIKELERSTPSDFAVSAQVAGGRIAIGGSLGGTRRTAHVTVSDVPVSVVAPYLAKVAGGVSPRAGRIRLEGDLAEEEGDVLAFRGSLRLDGGRVMAGGREIPVDMPATFHVASSGRRISVRELVVGLPGGAVSLSGHVDRLDGGALFDFGTNRPVEVAPADLRMLVALVAPPGSVEFDAAEPLRLDARVKGGRGKVEIEGSATARQLTVRSAILEQPLVVSRADVAFTGARARLSGFEARLGNSDLEGDMSLENFKSPRVEFNLSSREADLDQLFSFVTRARERAAERAPDAEPGLASKLTAKGRLEVGHATLKGLEFSRFAADVRLDGGVLTVTNATVAGYDGTAEADVRLDLSGGAPSMDLDAQLTGVDIQPLLVAGTGYSGLTGAGNAKLEYDVTASTLAQALAAGSGNGSVELRDGRLAGLAVMKALEKASVFGERSLANLGGRLADEGTSFDRLTATFTVHDGLLDLQRFEASTPDAVITGSGPVTLATQVLDIDGQAIFSEALSRTLRDEGSLAARGFWDARRNRVVLPFLLKGTVREPKAIVDLARAARQAAVTTGIERADEATGGLLGRILGRDGSPPGEAPAPPPSEEKPPTQQVQGQQAAGGDEPGEAPRSAEVTAQVTEARLGGNFLVPDLKLAVTLSGRSLSHAIVVVKNEGGRELYRDGQAWASVVAAAADTAAGVPVTASIDGKRLAGSREMTVEVTPVARDGSLGTTVSRKAGRGLPF